RDTGRGIPPQMLRRLFDRGAVRSEGSGLGLGLALSRDLVRALGGELTVHSGGLGTGATFSVDLPSANGSQAESLARSATQPAIRATRTESSRRLIGGDDDGSALMDHDEGTRKRLVHLLD